MPIFLLLIPVVFAAFIVFDLLVSLEYSSHRKSWEADGKPRGYFWSPSEIGYFNFSSGIATQRCSLVWLFSTPEWMRQDVKAKRLIFLMRILVVVWNIGILGSAIIRFKH
jgi:hypothetical protein